MSDEKVTFTITDDKPPASAAGDKPRRGRPPGSKNRTTAPRAGSEAATLKQALATMDSLYEFGTMGLAMFGLTESAMAWADSTVKLREQNEGALKAAPRLAAAIANAGSVGGATTFLVAHVMAVAGVMATVRAELSARRAPEESEPVNNVHPLIPGA